MRRVAVLAGLLLLAGGLGAQETQVARPKPDKPLRDVEFGVSVRAFGLERRVEMLQWQAAPRGYVRAWSDAPIDASGFAPGHANPVDWPLPARRWLAQGGSLDGTPLDPDVIATLGEWTDLRPGFNALPGNMAATFQPEGDGLGSADNPLAPKIGDLRIRWRQLVLPPLQGRVVLQAGRWVLAPVEVAAGRDSARSPPAMEVPKAGAPESAHRSWLLGGAVVVLIAAIAARRRRRNR